MPAFSPVYSFREFKLEPGESMLLRSGVAVQITPKAFRLLCLLVENQGHVLEKDEILSSVWEDSFVEEGNLTYNIGQLRKILGDDAKVPWYIETVPKRGYRFIANVERVEATNGHLSSLPAPAFDLDSQPPKRRSSWSPWLMAIPVILIAGGVVAVESWYGIFERNGKSPPLFSTPFSAERLSTDGDVFHAAISGSGDFAVYTAGNPNEKQSLRLRDLTNGQSREILEASEDRYIGLKLSHDDSTAYFVKIMAADRKETCMYRVKLLGGIPEKLACGMQGWFDLSNDGTSISLVRCNYDAEDYCSLYIGDADGRNERVVLTKKSPFRITLNAISPDGRSIAFAAAQSRDQSDDFGVYIYDINSGSERPATTQKFLNVGGLDWVDDESLLATALGFSDEQFYFWKLDVETTEAVPLASRRVGESYKTISLDGSGRKLLSTIRRSDFRVYVDTLNGRSEPTTLGRGWSPKFASDGRVLFTSDRSGKTGLWSADADGTNTEQFADGGRTQSPIDSPNGEVIFYSSNNTKRTEVWSIQKDGSGAKQITREEGGFPVGVSPDGYWVYYLSAISRTLRRVSNDGALEELVSKRTMTGITISPDGAWKHDAVLIHGLK